MIDPYSFQIKMLLDHFHLDIHLTIIKIK